VEWARYRLLRASLECRSLASLTSGKRETGIFVGLWAPTVLNLGQTLVEGSED
jgi:hypothetical protein